MVMWTRYSVMHVENGYPFLELIVQILLHDVY